MIQELNDRSREIFRVIVDEYVKTGEPVGSRTISRRLTTALSPASVRNVMADLEEIGLLHSPHTSAGRLPTETGLRLYVDALLQVGDLAPDEREAIEKSCSEAGHMFDDLVGQATGLLSGLSSHAGMVIAPKKEAPFRQVEFVSLAPDRALVIVVHEDGTVENRLIDLPAGITPAILARAGNYLNARVAGRTLQDAKARIVEELQTHEAELDALTQKVVETGLATWSSDNAPGERATLVVKGQANLLNDINVVSDLERIRDLFGKLDQARHLESLLDLTHDAEGVCIFIGADNELFQLTGCSTIVAPISDSGGSFVGALGIIGPTRMNYARIIPMVDYTAKVVGRLLG
jgi:heat-inducible transcriptional repressor